MPWGLLALLLLGLVVGIAILSVYTAIVLTHPPRRSYGWAVARGLAGDPLELAPAAPGLKSLSFESWNLQHDGITLPVWDVRGHDESGPVFVLTHGWGDSRTVMLGRAQALATMASRIVLWDLPGHGDSTRNARSTLGAHEHLALLSLLDRLQPTRPVVLYGYSLGAGVSLAAAAQSRERGSSTIAIAGVIAEAPYCLPRTPARNVLMQRGFPTLVNLPAAMLYAGLRAGQGATWLSSAPAFDRAAIAKTLGQPPARAMPLLILHGDRDAICPLVDAQAIARAHGHATLHVVSGAGHLNMWTQDQARSDAAGAVERFVRERVPPAGDQPGLAAARTVLDS